jgi:hypothetical protein
LYFHKTGVDELIYGLDIYNYRVRKPGGGPKKVIETVENIDEVFFDIVGENTAGSPMRADFLK